MADPSNPPTRLQRSLFPDAFEVQAASLAALRDLDVGAARRLLEQARRQNPSLVNLGLLHDALCLLETFPRGSQPSDAHLAEILTAARERHLAGQLSRDAAAFIDQTIARYWRRRAAAGPFLDEDARVHRAVLDLALGDAATARRHLGATLDGGQQHRADLWGYLGDACVALERGAEANACYVRGLLLSAADVDLMRLRLLPLVRLHEELRATYADDHARELLLVHAWLQGLLEIPPDNGWLDGQVARLRARAQADAHAPSPDRCRRFGLLLYLDRSQPLGQVDLALRKEMAKLDEDLFQCYMAACRQRE